MEHTDPKQNSETQQPAKTVGAGLIDFNQFRLGQNFDSGAKVEKLRTIVPVRKPGKQQFISVHPGPDHVLSVQLLEYGEQRELYMVSPEVEHPALEMAGSYKLQLYVNRSGDPFIWPLKIPDPDRPNGWHQSALDAAQRGKEAWIRVQSNQEIGAYEVYEATGNLPKPTWPQESFNKLLNIAFKGRILDSPNHIILRKLMGEE